MTSSPLHEIFSDDGLLILQLQRPKSRNALNKALVQSLRRAIAIAIVNPKVRVIALEGQGEKAFCAGADLKERATMPQEEVDLFVSSLRSLMDEVAACPKPTVALIHGFALGGGGELAMACDLRLAREDAKIGFPETHLGIIPGAGGTQRLARLLGPARAKELIFTARRLNAHEALDWGLVNGIASHEDWSEFRLSWIGKILRAAPIALVQAKKAIDQGLELPLEEAMAVERACYAVTIPTEDRLEALAAFREKRRPVFKGK